MVEICFRNFSKKNWILQMLIIYLGCKSTENVYTATLNYYHYYLPSSE